MMPFEATNTGSVFVASKGTIQNKPDCNTTGRFQFSLTEPYADTMLSVILSAYHAGSELVLTGTGDCAGGNSENLRKICTTDIAC